MNKIIRDYSLWTRITLIMFLSFFMLMPLLFAQNSSAIIIPLEAFIDGSQANAGSGTGSPASGTASMTLDTNTNQFSWNISWSGLLGDITVAHFHGPAPPNANAGVQVDFGAISGLVSPSIGSSIISDSQANDLLDDLWYINIHTVVFPGGEIRGQVVQSSPIPEPTTILLFGSGLFVLGAFRKKFRKK